VRVWHLLTQATGGPADHVADVAPVLASLGHDVTVVMPDGPAAARVEAAGVRRLDVAVASKRDAGGAARFAALLRAERPDVLHCQDRRAGLVGRIAARAARVPVVFTLHGAPDGLSHLVRGNLRAGAERRRDRLYYLHAERWLAWAGGGLIVAPSQAIHEFLVHQVGVPASRVRVVPNGVSLTRFTPARTGGAGVLWLGLMGPVKRLDVLLDALGRNGLRAVLAGDGPLRDEVRRAAAPLGEQVSMPGFVADPVPLFAAADVFVLCSAAENMPLSLLQAMACGVPVVATRVGGVPEVVRDGVDGLLVPPGNAAALATALTAVTPEMGAAGRQRVEEAFGIERCAAGLAGVYAEVAR